LVGNNEDQFGRKESRERRRESKWKGEGIFEQNSGFFRRLSARRRLTEVGYAKYTGIDPPKNQTQKHSFRRFLREVFQNNVGWRRVYILPN
jgi:hypothetical protein